MDVRPGYKRTEVGVIPSDWTATPLEGQITIGHGFGFKSDYFVAAGEYKLTTPGHFQEAGGFRDVGNKQKFYAGSIPDGYLLQAGDLIVVMTEQADGLLGSAAFVPTSGTYLHNQRLGRIRILSQALNIRFLFCVFNSPQYRRQVRESATGSKVKHTSPAKLLNIQVALPPTKLEQQSIAEVLGDADALIESLEQLLAKKRQIKQGAMQELLTGRRRLPGFKGKWNVKRLGDVAPLQRGFDLPRSMLEPGPYPVVTSNGVLNHHSSYQVTGPGVVTGRSGTIGTVTFLQHNFWPHNTSLWVTSFRGNDPRFIFYLYTEIGLERFATGSGVPTLNRNDVHDFSINIPDLKEEQAAIAAVFSDMDAEITALEAKLEKTRQLKQGMMQELLTGRIRLV